MNFFLFRSFFQDLNHSFWTLISDVGRVKYLFVFVAFQPSKMVDFLVRLWIKNYNFLQKNFYLLVSSSSSIKCKNSSSGFRFVLIQNIRSWRNINRCNHKTSGELAVVVHRFSKGDAKYYWILIIKWKISIFCF